MTETTQQLPASHVCGQLLQAGAALRRHLMPRARQLRADGQDFAAECVERDLARFALAEANARTMAD